MAPVLFVAICLVGFSLFQRRLATTPINRPIVFVALGQLAGANRRCGAALLIMEKGPQKEGRFTIKAIGASAPDSKVDGT